MPTTTESLEYEIKRLHGEILARETTLAKMQDEVLTAHAHAKIAKSNIKPYMAKIDKHKRIIRRIKAILDNALDDKAIMPITALECIRTEVHLVE